SHRLRVVVREERCKLLTLRAPLQPGGEAGVQGRTLRLQQALVGDFARERVLDRVLLLARDVGAGTPADEVTLLEQREVRRLAPEQLADWTGPEGAADQSRGLERRLL